MSAEPVQPEQVMTAHAARTPIWPNDTVYCAACRWNSSGGSVWPCETYRLAEALAAEQTRVRCLVGPFAEIVRQRARNHTKWGERSIENRQPDYAGWLPTLGEEFGEVCRAQTLEDASTESLRSELIDTAAVALMWIDSIDRAALAGDTEAKP